MELLRLNHSLDTVSTINKRIKTTTLKYSHWQPLNQNIVKTYSGIACVKNQKLTQHIGTKTKSYSMLCTILLIGTKTITITAETITKQYIPSLISHI